MTVWHLNQLEDSWKGIVVSEGTTRSVDLIKNFYNVLVSTNPQIANDLMATWEDVFATAGTELEDVDDIANLLTEMFDYLNAIAPAGYSFGTSDGDGACFLFKENN